MGPRVAFYTLGCKLNQLETDSFADAFARAGWTVLPFEPGPREAADLVVVNTCTVTGKAEQKARRIVRLALASDPRTAAIVTGCYAEVEAAALAAVDGRVLVVPGSVKQALLGLPALLAAGGGLSGDELLRELRRWSDGLARGAAAPGLGANVVDARFSFNPAAFAFHSRPSLKIQDGCDNACAYCRVRLARGASASLPAPEVLSRARALEAAGLPEIVLTGVNLSQYRDGDLGFPGLLELLAAETERVAFRITSYEPDRVDAAFLRAFAHPRVRPHLHLAIQSGADPVLARMGRRYGRSEVLAAVKALRGARRDPFLAADLISGFPGETEADAAATLDLARECDFASIHVFRYSRRPGTAAASMPDLVPERLTRERVEALRELSRAGRAGYVYRWVGSELQAVLEVSPDGGATNATSDNYLKLKVLGLPEDSRPGTAIRCRLEKMNDSGSLEEQDAFALYIGDGVIPALEISPK